MGTNEHHKTQGELRLIEEEEEKEVDEGYLIDKAEYMRGDR